MKIRSAEFVISAVGPKQYPDDNLPEIAFVGRSNVGKSSLINALLQRRGLARTSSTPGRTQTMNYYRINGDFYFVDLPGYGYAKAPRSEQQKWARFSEAYLLRREPLHLVIHLIDSRHAPMEIDMTMADWLAHSGRNVILVATKADKLSGNELQKNLALFRKTVLANQGIVLVSSATGRGRDELWARIEEALPAEGKADFDGRAESEKTDESEKADESESPMEG